MVSQVPLAVSNTLCLRYNRGLLCFLMCLDPYLQVWATVNGKKCGNRKSSVKERTLNPVFNETFSFEISHDKLRNSSVTIDVIDHDKFNKNDVIGRIVLAGKSATEGGHWNEMINAKGSAVSKWHKLEPVPE